MLDACRRAGNWTRSIQATRTLTPVAFTKEGTAMIHLSSTLRNSLVLPSLGAVLSFRTAHILPKVGLVVAASAVFACSADVSEHDGSRDVTGAGKPSATALRNLVADLPLAGQHHAYFFVSDDNVAAVVETGPASTPLVLNDTLVGGKKPAEIYSMLSGPNAPPPARLLAAGTMSAAAGTTSAVAVASGGHSSRVDPSPAKGGPGPRFYTAGDQQYFSNTYCTQGFECVQGYYQWAASGYGPAGRGYEAIGMNGSEALGNRPFEVSYWSNGAWVVLSTLSIPPGAVVFAWAGNTGTPKSNDATYQFKSNILDNGLDFATVSLADHTYPHSRVGDYDGDGQTDYAVWRPSDTNWYVLLSGSQNAPSVTGWGVAGDIPIAGDYDGDGKADWVTWRRSNGWWNTQLSGSNYTPYYVGWGLAGDIPVAGDFDGDGKTDFATFRPSNGWWNVLLSGSNNTPYYVGWGTTGDIPVPADYDGDGKTDYATYTPSNGVWHVRLSGSNNASYSKTWGNAGDIPTPGDFDGDGRADIATFRPSNGWWNVLLSGSNNTQHYVGWGLKGDVPVVGDFDGDGRTDYATFRPSNGWWNVLLSGSNNSPYYVGWGTAGDIPTTFAPNTAWRLGAHIQVTAEGHGGLFASVNLSALETGQFAMTPTIENHDQLTGYDYLLSCNVGQFVVGYQGHVGADSFFQADGPTRDTPGTYGIQDPNISSDWATVTSLWQANPGSSGQFTCVMSAAGTLGESISQLFATVENVELQNLGLDQGSLQGFEECVATSPNQFTCSAGNPARQCVYPDNAGSMSATNTHDSSACDYPDPLGD
jgi:hypothetical protein